jgi:tRNA pseudouridine13 synthase
MKRPIAKLKVRPEDFVVTEVPAYEPTGQGEHLYVSFRKVGQSTDDAVRALSAASGAHPKEAGVAGLKDKWAVTTQTVSFLAPRGVDRDQFRQTMLAVQGPALSVLAATYHGNKLRTGHLTGNRFEIVLRGLSPADVPTVVAGLERAGKEGVPNAYGSQRFGREHDNAVRAKRWIVGGERPPRDPRARRFDWSALQSAIFNDVLAERVESGTWRQPMDGDVLQKVETGGLFLCDDVATDRERALRGEVGVTGPLPGTKMKAPVRAAKLLEDRVISAWLGSDFDFGSVAKLGEGTRRPLCLQVAEMKVEPVLPDGLEENAGGAALKVYFVLPKGGYATTVLASVVDTGSVSPGTDAPPLEAGTLKED